MQTCIKLDLHPTLIITMCNVLWFCCTTCNAVPQCYLNISFRLRLSCVTNMGFEIYIVLLVYTNIITDAMNTIAINIVTSLAGDVTLVQIWQDHASTEMYYIVNINIITDAMHNNVIKIALHFAFYLLLERLDLYR